MRTAQQIADEALYGNPSVGSHLWDGFKETVKTKAVKGSGEMKINRKAWLFVATMAALVIVLFANIVRW